MVIEAKSTTSFCNRCVRHTNHDVLAKHEDFNTFGHAGYVYDGYFIIKCAGCGWIHFIHRHQTQSGYDPYNRVKKGFTTEYPPPVARAEPEWLSEVDETLKQILQECYVALQNGSRILATTGARTALEHLMLMSIGDQGSFRGNIEKFIEQGYVQSNLKQSLLDALEAGHAAAHRGYAPTDDVLSSLFDILEGIINATLILPGRASEVQKVTPPRQKKTKANEAS